MKPVELKVECMGNSRGVRIPAATLQRYEIGDRIIMEERSDGILLLPCGGSRAKLSWIDTANEMAAASEERDDWESTTADDLHDIQWKRRKLPTCTGLIRHVVTMPERIPTEAKHSENSCSSVPFFTATS